MPLLILAVNILILIVVVLLYLVCWKVKKVREAMMKWKRAMIWNSYIRLNLETSLDVLMAAMIRTFTMNFDNVSESLSSLYAIAMLAMLGLAPIVIPIFLKRN